MRVFIVEDMPRHRVAFKKELEAAGFKVCFWDLEQQKFSDLFLYAKAADIILLDNDLGVPFEGIHVMRSIMSHTHADIYAITLNTPARGQMLAEGAKGAFIGKDPDSIRDHVRRLKRRYIDQK
jgi:DNA-binding response OmpR family regulator